MHRGFPALQRRLHSTEGSRKLDLALIPLMDVPSPKLDQHEPSHSRALHVIK
jgi:hypothetical protein